MNGYISLIFSVFLILMTSCEEEKDKLDLLMIIGDVKCNQAVCKPLEFSKNHPVSIQTKKNSLIDFVLNSSIYVRVYQNSSISINVVENSKKLVIQLEKGKLFIVNQQEFPQGEIDQFSLLTSTPNNQILSKKAYFSIENQGNVDEIKIHDGDLKIKKDSGYSYVNVKRTEEENNPNYKKSDFFEPMLIRLSKNNVLEKTKLLEDDIKNIKENIFTLLHGKKNQIQSKIFNKYSPNYDGRKDRFQVKIANKLSEDTEGWNLKVYDAQYHLQREFNSPWNPSINDVPNLFEWDLINHAGKIVKEQFHVYHLTERNTNFSEIRLFEVDLTPPYANIEVKPISFSPEVDQQLTIKTNLDPNAKWTMKIKDHKQEIIFSKDLSPRDRQVVWNGKTSRGKALDDGQYFLEIDGLDAAENLYAYRKNIYIDRNQYRVDVKSSEAIFSPNGDGYLDYVKFTTSITNSNRIQIAKWFFEIKQNHETVKSWEGFGSVPEIIWDGKNQRNQKLQDGQYQFIMKITLVTEVELKSVLQTIAIDTSPPQIVINFEGNFDDFTPDASGLNDTLQIKNQIHDQSPIINWKVNIYQEEFLLQTLSGLNQPKDTIIWDGRTNLRELESFEEYSLELIATDAMNLTGYSKRIKFETGAILIHSERGDLIRISNILFETNSAELMGEKTFRVIKKLAKALLQKYQNIPISIEGHTDSEGEDRNFDNRGLSERRALSVKNAIQLEGVRQPIEHFGHGFQYPLFQPERNAYEKQMNRRVDFLLKKKERQIVKPKVKVIRGKSR